jgi:AAA+ superfamily predicted ATPase
MDIKEKINNYLRAGFPVLAINTSEETKTLDMLKSIADKRKRVLKTWSVTRGVMDLTGKTSDETVQDPTEFIKQSATGGKDEDGIYILLDPNTFLRDDPVLVRSIRDFLPEFKSGRTLVLMGVCLEIPSDIRQIVTVIDMPLPDREELEKTVRDICEPNKIDVENGVLDRTLNSLSGLTTDEAGDAISLSIIEHKRVDPTTVMREKCTQLSKRPFLKVASNIPSLEDVGGMDELKKWLTLHREMFSRKAREFRCPTPKGFLTIGPPGCGKSLVSMATASVLELPLVELIIGNIMGGIVGETEKNTTEAIKIMEAMAPVVVRIEELDKQFGGSVGQDTSHEVTKRMMSKLLTWLQEKTAPVFVVATANRIEALASTFPELLRKGRWDEIWYVDLPNSEERKEIFRVHIRKVDREPDEFDLNVLSDETKDFQGVEIECAVTSAVKMAFGAGDKDVTTAHIQKAIKQTVPQSKLAKENLDQLRQWAKGRARNATDSEEYEYFDPEQVKRRSKRKIEKDDDKKDEQE